MYKQIVKLFIILQVILIEAELNETKAGDEINNYDEIINYVAFFSNEGCESECFIHNTLLDDSNDLCNRNSTKNISHAFSMAKRNTTFEKNQYNISDGRESNRMMIKYENGIEYCQFTFLRTNCLYSKLNYSTCQLWDESDQYNDSKITWVRFAADIINLIFVGVTALLLFYLFRRNKKKRHQPQSLKQKNRRFLSVNEQLI